MLAAPVKWPSRAQGPPYLNALVVSTSKIRKRTTISKKKGTTFEGDTTYDIHYTHSFYGIGRYGEGFPVEYIKISKRSKWED